MGIENCKLKNENCKLVPCEDSVGIDRLIRMKRKTRPAIPEDVIERAAELRELVIAAFKDVPLPTPRQICSSDDPESSDIRWNFQAKRWDEVTFELFRDGTAPLCFFEAEAFHYHTQSCIQLVLADVRNHCELAKNLAYWLAPSFHERNPVTLQNRIKLFSKQQLLTVGEFLDWFGNTEWGRNLDEVAEAKNFLLQRLKANTVETHDTR